jgi:hypothetical protein
MIYRGYTIDLSGVNAYVSGPGVDFAMVVPKQEGISLEQCAQNFVDTLLASEDGSA